MKGEQAEHTKKIAGTLNGLLDVLGLDDDQRQEAGATVTHLRRLADEPQPEAGRLVQLYEKAATVAVSGSGAAVGEAVVHLVRHALQLLRAGVGTIKKLLTDQR